MSERDKSIPERITIKPLTYPELLDRRVSFLEARTGFSTELGKEGRVRRVKQSGKMSEGKPVDFSKRIRFE